MIWNLLSWLSSHPAQVAQWVLLSWSVATILAGLYLWRQAVKADTPKAAGLKSEHRRISS